MTCLFTVARIRDDVKALLTSLEQLETGQLYTIKTLEKNPNTPM